MNLNHMHVKVSDIAASRSFYEKYFGFRLAFEEGPLVFLRNDAGYLLTLHPYKQDEPVVQFPDWFHFGFCVDSHATVAQMYERMRADGVRFKKELNGEDGKWTNFYALDPSGYNVEVSWDASELQLLKPVSTADSKR